MAWNHEFLPSSWAVPEVVLASVFYELASTFSKYLGQLARFHSLNLLNAPEPLPLAGSGSAARYGRAGRACKALQGAALQSLIEPSAVGCKPTGKPSGLPPRRDCFTDTIIHVIIRIVNSFLGNNHTFFARGECKAWRTV